MLDAEEAHPHVGMMAENIVRQVAKRYPHEVETYRELVKVPTLVPYERRRLDKVEGFLTREIGHGIVDRMLDINWVTVAITRSHGLGEDFARACVVSTLMRVAFRMVKAK